MGEADLAILLAANSKHFSPSLQSCISFNPSLPPLSPILSPNQSVLYPHHQFCNPCIHSYTPSYLFTLTNFFHADLMLLPTQYFFVANPSFFFIFLSHYILHSFTTQTVFCFSFFLFSLLRPLHSSMSDALYIL